MKTNKKMHEKKKKFEIINLKFNEPFEVSLDKALKSEIFRNEIIKIGAI